MDANIFTINSTDFNITINTFDTGTISLLPKEQEFTIEFTTNNKFILSDNTTYQSWFPEYRTPYVKVPNGRYHPRDFGLTMIGVSEINVGECPTKIKWPYGILAHAHENEGVICISDGHYVLESEGKADEALRHEHAHILAGPLQDHGPVWIEIAKSLGIKNPSPKIYYTYSGLATDPFGVRVAPFLRETAYRYQTQKLLRWVSEKL